MGFADFGQWYAGGNLAALGPVFSVFAINNLNPEEIPPPVKAL